MALIDPDILIKTDRFQSAVSPLDKALNDPMISKHFTYGNTSVFREIISDGTELLALPREVLGRCVLIVLLYMQVLRASAKQLKNAQRHANKRALDATLAALRKEGFVLVPAEARMLVENCMPVVFENKLLPEITDAAIEGSSGEGSADFLSAMNQLGRIDLIDMMSHSSNIAPQLSQCIEASNKALEAIGGQRANHPALRAMQDAAAIEEQITVPLEGIVDPMIVQALAAGPELDKTHRAANGFSWLVFSTRIKEMDLAERSALFEDFFVTGEYLGQHPYFETAIGAKSTRIPERISYEDRWGKLSGLMMEMTQKKLVLSQARALLLIDDAINGNLAFRPRARKQIQTGHMIGEVRFYSAKVQFFRAVAAALPSGDPAVEAKVRGLALKHKHRAILLEAVARIDPKEDLDTQRRDAINALDAARRGIQLNPQPTGSAPKQSFGALLKDWFAPKPSPTRTTPRRSREIGGSMKTIRQLASAVIQGQRCGLDVVDDLMTLDALIEQQLAGADSYAQNECRDIRHHLGILAALTPDQHADLERLMPALLPLPDGSKPNATWLKTAEPFLTSEVEEVTGIVLSDLRPAQMPGGRYYDGSFRMYGAGLFQEELFMIALVWLSGRFSGGLAESVEMIATASSTEATSANRLCRAALWSLSEMPGGAGHDGLMRLSQSLPNDSLRQQAKFYLNASAANSQGGADMVETVTIDHGLATGERVENRVLGAARLAYVAPADIAVTWDREDGKLGKVPTPAMKKADPAGIASIKKLVATIKADLLAQSEWMPHLYLLDRSLPFADWRDRYLTHGTFGPLTRGLIWQVANGPTFMIKDDAFLSLDAEPVALEEAEIMLWHPLHARADDVSGWRDMLFQHGIVQPFPQAWRDTYVIEPGTQSAALFEGHIVAQKPLRKSMLASGWAGSTLSNKSPNGRMVYHVPQTDIALTLALHQPVDAPDVFHRNRGDRYLVLGAIEAIKLPLGASPTATDLKRGRRLELASLPRVLISELLRHVAVVVDAHSEALSRRGNVNQPWMVATHAPYREAYREDPGTVQFRRLCKLLDFVISRQALTALSRDGKSLSVKGNEATYLIDFVTFDIAVADTDDVVYLQVKPTQLVTDSVIPHGLDPKLYKALAMATKLQQDTKLLRAKGYSASSMRRRKRTDYDR